jgi:hypothetical protein
MAAERAHVDVELILGDEASCSLCASNHGRSVAYIGMYLFAHHHYPVIPNKGLPEDWREHNFSVERRGIDRMLPVGKRVTLKQFPLSLSEAERSGKDQAIYRGAVTYSDSFGKYETELVYRYDPPGKFTNLPRYNRYEKKQSEEKAN